MVASVLYMSLLRHLDGSLQLFYIHGSACLSIRQCFTRVPLIHWKKGFAAEDTRIQLTEGPSSSIVAKNEPEPSQCCCGQIYSFRRRCNWPSRIQGNRKRSVHANNAVNRQALNIVHKHRKDTTLKSFYAFHMSCSNLDHATEDHWKLGTTQSRWKTKTGHGHPVSLRKINYLL